MALENDAPNPDVADSGSHQPLLQDSNLSQTRSSLDHIQDDIAASPMLRADDRSHAESGLRVEDHTNVFDQDSDELPDSHSSNGTSSVNKEQEKADVHAQPDCSTTWKQSYWRYGPITGIACIVLAVFSLLASLAVLLASNNQPQSAWKWKPATYIAIFTAISNQAIRYAAMQGVVVSWWGTAIRQPASLQRLHQEWEAGTGLLGSLVSLRRLSTLGIACLASTLVAIDGRLLQQALAVGTVPVPLDTIPVALNFTIAPQIPTNFTGSLQWDNQTISRVYNAAVTDAMIGAFMSNSSMEGFVSGCEGTCTAVVRGPALTATRCDKLWFPINYNTMQQSLEVEGPVQGPRDGNFTYRNRLAMLVENNVIIEDAEYINLTTITAHTSGCVGMVNQTSCLLGSAIAEYQVMVENKTIHLPGSVSRPTIVSLSNNTNSFSTLPSNTSVRINDTIIGVAGTVLDMINMKARIIQAEDFQITMIGPYGASLVGTKNVDTSDNGCGDWTDPYDNILDVLNRNMFWLGLNASESLAGPSDWAEYFDPGLTTHQTVQGYRAGTWIVYKTNFLWVIGAAVLQSVCIAVVIPTYWRWWELGRAVSFSPLEFAKAFEAPLLQDYDSNLEVNALAKAVRDRELQYGVVTSQGETGAVRPMTALHKLAFGTPITVARP